MALRSITQLKTWFRKGAYPLASQFADWMDSYWHKEEKIPIDSVEQLAEQLNGKYDGYMTDSEQVFVPDFAEVSSNLTIENVRMIRGSGEVETVKVDMRLSTPGLLR